MDAQVSIVDFEDSFTYNICSLLAEEGVKSEVIHYQKIDELVRSLRGKCDKHVVVLGPGPGHPLSYTQIFPSIQVLMDMEDIFKLGICLGHQIFWSNLGRSIRRDSWPVHGQNVPVEIPAWPEYFEPDHWGMKLLVQRYNSLLVCDSVSELEGQETFSADGRVMFGKFRNGLTYQFHPESVGTSCPKVFIHPVKRFLQYNHTDASKNQSQRSLQF